MLINIDHLSLAVRDLKSAVAQYTVLLGREPNWQGSGDGVEHAWFQLDNLALELVAPIGSDAGGTSHPHTHGQARPLRSLRHTYRQDSHVLERAACFDASQSIIQPANLNRTPWITQNCRRRTQGVTSFLIGGSPGRPWPGSTTSAPECCISGLYHTSSYNPNPERARVVCAAWDWR